jgi:hypothetical protein
MDTVLVSVYEVTLGLGHFQLLYVCLHPCVYPRGQEREMANMRMERHQTKARTMAWH